MERGIRTLRVEHADLLRLLDLLDRQLGLLGQGGQPDYDLIGGILDYCLDYPDAVHHRHEDLVFDKLRARDAAAAEAVGDLAAEHAELAARTRKLANAVTRVIGEETVERASVHALAEDLVRAYRRHIAFEEERFFPAAEAALTEADWAEIDARLDAPDDPLFGDRVAARFRDLREDIDSLVRIAGKA